MRSNAGRIRATAVASGLLLVATSGALAAGQAEVPVETFTLDNGLELLLVPRPEMTTVSAGWVAKVGSANERPGITGLSHLFEHMMFKGSHAIGTTNIERDLEIILEQEQLQEQIRAIYEEQRRRWRLGEIDDPFSAEERTDEQLALEERFQALVDEQRELMVKDEFDKIYTEAGASGMNAGTTEDLTLYFITIPANKLELWFWMESDRLNTPVFREFYSERDVVHEERRMRTESTPTGKFDEQFEAMFWQSHPYSWPVVGWPSDLRTISKEQADEYFSTYYAPNNLTVALVGNFDVDAVKSMAQRYFGRIPAGERRPPDVVTLEMEQLAEKRMNAECDCQPQVEVRYHTVPFMHADSYALDVLEGLLNGQTGRLYKALILDKEIASTAAASQNSRKYGGGFSFFAEVKGSNAPADLEAAWYAELDKLISEPIPAEELQKVKNQIAASAFRRLETPFFLLLQLLFYEGLGDWNYMNTWADKTLAVTEEDVKRVAQTYLVKDNRAVAEYFRKAGSEEEELPEGVAALPAQQQQMVKAQLRRIREETDVNRLQEALEQIETQESQMPPEFRGVLEIMKREVGKRIDQLKAEGGE